MFRTALLAATLVGCANTTAPVAAPPSPMSRTDVHAPATASDGETLGADESVPTDHLNRGARVSFRPGEANPFALEPAPGWVVGPNGPEPAAPETKTENGSIRHRPKR
jgi:hypothetical protein